MLAVTRSGGRVRFRVRVTPRASATAVGGERDGALLVRVTASPADGRANEAVTRLVARAVGVAPSEVSLEAGHTARTKTLSLPAAALRRLLLLCN